MNGTLAEQISKNIEAKSSFEQENAADTEQISRAADDLSKLIVNLQYIVSRFRISNQLSAEARDKEESGERMAVREKGTIVNV